MKKYIAILLFALFLLQVPAAFAYSVPFTDTVNYWDGWGNDSKYNGSDTVGTPNLTGGAFIYEDHTLVGIDLNYATTHDVLTPGDWFFDFDQDGYWDYVLHHWLQTYNGQVLNDYGYGLYAVHLDASDEDSYVMSFWPDRYDGRDDHPALADLSETGIVDYDVSFSGWLYSGASPYTSSWSDFAIDLNDYKGQTFTYAFAMTCANDVLYGESRVPAPEPGTFILLGLGLLGVFSYARKKRHTV